MDTRKPLDLPAISLLIVLCLIWGFQQITLKASAHEIPPMLQLGLRSAIGAVLVWLFMRARGERMDFTDGIWKPGFAAGALFGIEFIFLGEGLRHTSAAHSIVLLYTAPIFAALGLHWKLPSERLAPLQWLGIVLAFSGIAVTFLLREQGQMAPADLSAMLWGDFLALLAGLCWGATTVVIRTTRVAALPATQTTMYQLISAAVILLMTAPLLGQTHFAPTIIGWSSLAFQALIVAFVSLLAWFWLLRNYLASRLGAFSFMAPLFGVLLGAWLLGERIEASFVLGAALVLAGIVLVNAHAWIMQALAGRAAQR